MRTIWQKLIIKGIDGLASPLGGDYYLSSVLPLGTEEISEYCARYAPDKSLESVARPKIFNDTGIDFTTMTTRIINILTHPIARKCAESAFRILLTDSSIGKKIIDNVADFESHHIYAKQLNLI